MPCLIQRPKEHTGAGLVIALLIGSCRSVDQPPCNALPVTTQAPQTEVSSLKHYIAANKINATADARGFYYHGAQVQQGIPANSILVFQLDLIKIN